MARTPFLQKIQEKYKLMRWLERPRLGDFFNANIVRWLLFLNIFSLIVIVGILTWFIRPTDYPIILRYSVFFGIEDDSMGPWYHTYHLPIFGLGVFLFNSLLAFFSYRHRERIVAYILLLGSFLLQCAIAITSVTIILIN